MKTFLLIVAALAVLFFAAPSLGAGPPSILEGGVQTFNTDLKINGDLNVIGTITGTLAPVGDLTLSGDLFVDGGDIGITADPDLLQLVNGALTVNGTGEFTGNISLEHPGVSSDSRKIFFYADVAAASKVGSIYVAADVGIGAPGLVISVPDIATGVETPVFAILSTVFGFAIDGTVDIGATGSFRPKDIYLSGNLNAEAGHVIANGNLTATTGNLSVPLGSGTFGGDVFIGNGGTDTHSYVLRLRGDVGGEQQYGGLKIDYTIPALVLAGPSGVGGGWTEVLQVAGDGYLTFVAAEGNIGVTGDEDLIYLATDEVNIGGDVSVTGALEATADLWVAGGVINELTYWYQDNVVASQTDVVINMDGNTGRAEVPTVRGGSVIGITVYSNEARPVGTLTVEVTIDGAGTGLTAVLDVTNPNTKVTTQGKDNDQFTAGQRIGATLTTDGTWEPVTADITVVVLIEQ